MKPFLVKPHHSFGRLHEPKTRAKIKFCSAVAGQRRHWRPEAAHSRTAQYHYVVSTHLLCMKDYKNECEEGTRLTKVLFLCMSQPFRVGQLLHWIRRNSD